MAQLAIRVASPVVESQDRLSRGLETGGPASGDDELVHELRQTFARLRPQGGLAWNFEVTFERLATAFSERPGAEPGRSDAVHPGSGAGRAKRPSRLFGRAWASDIERRIATVERGLGDVVEALRFIAARVEALETKEARRRSPVPAVSSLVEPVDVTPWIDAVVGYLKSTAPGLRVVHCDSGHGDMVATLVAAGFEATGVEPRGEIAAGADGGHAVVDDALPFLRRCEPSSLDALVLSGVVDVSPIDELIALVDEAARCLVDRAPLVVIGSDPASAESTWTEVARDFVTQRGVHSESWRVLLEDSGFGAIETLSATPAGLPNQAQPGAPASAMFGLAGLRGARSDPD